MQESNITTNLFTELVNHMPHSVLIANRDGELTFCNKVIEPTFGENIISVLKNSWADKFDVYTVDRTYKYTIDDLPITKAIRGELLVGEKMRIKAIGYPNEVYIRMCAYPIEVKQELLTVIIFEDITKEQLVYEDVLKRLVDVELYVKTELKRDFLFNPTIIENDTNIREIQA